MSAAQPQTQFVRVGDADVAYQVLGQGPPDLLLFGGIESHVELNWPIFGDYYTRLAAFSRLVMFDRRGAGASDPAPPNATWEELTEDLRAVLDAIGSERAVIVGVGESSPFALLFTAMHPERVSALVLLDGYARMLEADDYPMGYPEEGYAEMVKAVRELWGTTDLVRLVCPSRSEDQTFLERGAALNRASATPRSVAEWVQRYTPLDVRHVLPLIRVPTLVLHAKDNAIIPIEMGRYLADHIHGARFIELPGGDASLAGDSALTLPDEISEFLTGQRPVEVDRVLATVLFTDIANSTATAAAMGDRRWRSLLDTHDQAVREQLRRFRGKEINTTGDGFVASLDGPARAIRCALAIIEATRPLGIELRAGLHTGECEVRGSDLGGLAVHIAARVGALADPGELLVSSTVKDLVVGSGIEFTDRGEHKLKGVPGTWKLFAGKN